MAGTRDTFEYQAPTPEMVVKITDVREGCKSLAAIIERAVPPCAERTLAIRKLEECSMWANKAIVFDGERYLY